MILRVLRSARRRSRRAVELLRQRVVQAGALRAVDARPPRRGAPVAPEEQGRELLGRLARLLSLDHLTRFGLQADSAAGYDALALRASGGRLDAAQLAAARPGRERLDFAGVVALARAMQQHGHPGTAAVLDAALAARRPSRRGELILLAQLLLLEGRGSEAGAVLGELGRPSRESRLLAGDLVNPFTAADGGSPAAWAETLAGIYRGSGIESFAVAAGPADSAPFDRLTSGVAPGSVPDGPLVSVIMTAFRPDAAAVTAARSILDQSWRNLELLVMDDASGPEHAAALDGLARLDDRVRVVRAAENAGTYIRRNEALQLARGEFVTMQDSDDWSHPRRLELQLRHLQAHPELPANLVTALRVTHDLEFVQPRGLHLRLCEPALMFRREPVVDRIGFFDSVRRSADSEFRVRIAQVYGGDPPVIRPLTPLMIMRSDRASLSGSDFGDGWTHPSRFAYRSAYLQWQARELREGRTPRMEFPLGRRPFPAPARIEGRPDGPRHHEVVVAGDGRWDSLLPAAPEIATVLDAQPGQAAFLQIPSFRSPESLLIAGPLQQRINEGAIAELSLSDEAEVELLILAHPDAALGLPRLPGRIRARRVVVLVEPSAASGDGRGYAAELVERACRDFFGTAPERRAAPIPVEAGGA